MKKTKKPVQVSDGSQPFKVFIMLIALAGMYIMGGKIINLLEQIAKNTAQ